MPRECSSFMSSRNTVSAAEVISIFSLQLDHASTSRRSRGLHPPRRQGYRPHRRCRGVCRRCEEFVLLLDAREEDEHLDSTLMPRLAHLLGADVEEFVHLICFEEKTNSSMCRGGVGEFILLLRVSMTRGGFEEFVLLLCVDEEDEFLSIEEKENILDVKEENLSSASRRSSSSYSTLRTISSVLRRSSSSPVTLSVVHPPPRRRG